MYLVHLWQKCLKIYSLYNRMKKLLLIIILLLVFLLKPSITFAQGMMGGWGGFGILGWVSMLLFWSLLILGVIALFRYLSGSGKTTKNDKTPLEILKERYARGEIDKKEFEEKKKALV